MENKNVISDPKEKATILNDFFIEQTNLDISSAALPPMNFIQTRKFLSTVITSKEEVFNLLNSVNVAKACGYDGIGNRILKLCARGISYSFSIVINISLELGVFPDSWKCANVVPLFSYLTFAKRSCSFACINF